MRRHYTSNLKAFSRKLRSTMTEAETRLWNRIRKKQVNNFQFYRQRPLGNYIVDFYCPIKKLVIEIDGGQHYENGEITKEDAEREDFLKETLGLKILRFTNIDVMKNIASVIEKIVDELK